jgi:hypothetical protein
MVAPAGGRYEMDVPEDIRIPAERALRRMFEATG